MRPRRREPAALVPAPAARLIGFVLLAALGVAQWTRMVDGQSFAGSLGWVALGAAVGALLWASDRLPARWRTAGAAGAVVAGLLAAVPVAGIDLGLLKPRRWDELADGLARGSDVLATARLPYQGADPWPELTLALLGAVLCVTAAALALWPRDAGTAGRGFPFVSLAVLLTLAATPVVSLGGTRPVVFGGVLAALVIGFLWLERLPLRPGFGVAALLGIALAGALPLAGAADRESPWFDYRAFAEGVGGGTPVRFDWGHSYDPISWPRERREILRVRTPGPEYWKAESLEDFRDDGWNAGPATARSELPLDLRDEWIRRFDVSVRQLRSTDVIGAGTILAVTDPSRPVRREASGTFRAVSELRRGDTYGVRAYVPRPSREELSTATSGLDGRHPSTLRIFTPSRGAAEITVPPFGTGGSPSALFADAGRFGSGAAALDESAYARTWRLARRLSSRAETPFEYVAAVDRYLHGTDFTYSERPIPPPAGVAPLEGFLFDTRDGYCQHYSGAMALLLRLGGVPARVATGFSPGGRSERRGDWVVRDNDAHSWVEAWFDDIGWVAFDPTPSATPARSQIAALPESAPPDATADASGDDAPDDAGGAAADDSGKDLRGDPSAGADDAAADAAGGNARWIPWIVAAAAVAGIGLVARRRRRRDDRARPAASLDRAIADLERAFRRVGWPTPPGTTLRRLEGRLTGSDDAAGYVRRLRAARYATAAERPTAAQRRAVRRELARGRGWTGRVRALWALPPRGL